jgi:hypothetical protein
VFIASLHKNSRNKITFADITSQFILQQQIIKDIIQAELNL